MDQLQTERLTLRPITPDDFPAIHAYANDPAVIDFMPWGPNSEVQTREYIERTIAEYQANPRKAWQFAITLRAARQTMLGAIGLSTSPDHPRFGVLGYVLRRESWGQGLVTEAARAVFAHGFDHLNLHRIEAYCVRENVASSTVMRKIGMTFEGRHRCAAAHRDGTWHDTCSYAILRGDPRS